jgi:hypothetical protein
MRPVEYHPLAQGIVLIPSEQSIPGGHGRQRLWLPTEYVPGLQCCQHAVALHGPSLPEPQVADPE